MGTTNLDSLELGGNLTVAGTETVTGNITYAGNVTLGDASGDAITLNGTTTAAAPVTVGEDDTGYDVKFYGATASKFMVWDESADDLILADGVALQLGGDESTADGFKVEFDGTATLAVDALTTGDQVKIGFNTPTGFQLNAQDVTPNNDDGGASTIGAGVTAVDVQAVTNDANDWIVLPSLANVAEGHTIKISCNAGGNFELRTPASSNEKINNVDSDGTQEYLCTDTDTVIIWKLSDTDGWIAQSITNLGAVRTAVVPD